MRATVAELGEQRATGFLKKFYGWYLGRGRFPKPFKQELVQLGTLAEVEERLFAAAPGAAEALARLEGELPGRGGRPPRSPHLDLRRRLRQPSHRYNSGMAVATGERRIVSVLVADVVGSTAIGEKLGPERSKFLIDEVMRIMTEQVRRFDGTVAQLVGDEMLALFGVPVSHEDDAERALRAALAIQRALAQYAHEVEAAYGVELAVRIGVNTGPVVVGVQGDGEDGYDPFNALGDTVNVASRLQEIAGHGGVVIGPTTKRQVETGFELEEMGSQDLKGVGAPLETFRVTKVLESEPVAAQPAARRPRLRADRARAHDGRARRGPRRDRLDHGRAGNRQDAARLGGARPLPRPHALHRGARASPTRRRSPTGRSATSCASGSASARRRRRRASAWS